MIATLLLLASVAAPALASGLPPSPKVRVPSVNVPACPKKATVSYNKSVPDKQPFPNTLVDLCYDNTAIQLTFTAQEETEFYFDPAHTTNDPLWAYNVMEAFISLGTNDPKHYLEFEVSPNNATFNAFIYNPSKVRAPDAPMDTFWIQTPIVHGMTAETTINKEKQLWVSKARIPLGLFNVDDGKAKGTQWRMNFFRTITSPETFPAQELGAWSTPDEASFHKTPFFGNVKFV
ncbi:hypothetical protein BDV98DRAFT_576683 [Pterulicium gracile]|uniref:Carbohydrate-binding domain-containing protein n=1 Tax=Pterulicium gracile TaxID=1884261 RepID=A0A5C3Q2V4_9AGAR|nr:hypothetical protein BDV98DRAFT_576683 [Pterula gracilis]